MIMSLIRQKQPFCSNITAAPVRAAAFIQLFSGFSLSALIEEIFKELLDEADDLSSLAFSAIIKNVLNKFKYFTH